MSYYDNESATASGDEQPTDPQAIGEDASLDALDQAEAVEEGVGDGLVKQLRPR
jgi:hypothetical protein